MRAYAARVMNPSACPSCFLAFRRSLNFRIRVSSFAHDPSNFRTARARARPKHCCLFSNETPRSLCRSDMKFRGMSRGANTADVPFRFSNSFPAISRRGRDRCRSFSFFLALCLLHFSALDYVRLILRLHPGETSRIAHCQNGDVNSMSEETRKRRRRKAGFPRALARSTRSDARTKRSLRFFKQRCLAGDQRALESSRSSHLKLISARVGAAP